MTRLMIIGEAWGEEEAKLGRPFIGTSGKFLRAMLRNVGIDSDEAYMTNVFNLRPPNSNDVKNLCGNKIEGIQYSKFLLRGGQGYVKAQYAPEIERLWREINVQDPNLILALGNTAIWALLAGQNTISAVRGRITESIKHPLASRKYKVMPTFHPAAVLRAYTTRPIFAADLFKARKDIDYPDIRWPQREIWIKPTLDDLDDFLREYIARQNTPLSVDIETAYEQITEIGFAPDPHHALVVPFISRENEDGNYWPTLENELKAWQWVRQILATHPYIIGQNFVYDLKWLWHHYHLAIPGFKGDTMLMQHSQQPEMEKSLGFLASIHSDEGVWKGMRKRNTTTKRED